MLNNFIAIMNNYFERFPKPYLSNLKFSHELERESITCHCLLHYGNVTEFV